MSAKPKAPTEPEERYPGQFTEDDGHTYCIVRNYAGDRKSRVIKRGLTLGEARRHCCDPETSSSTCTKYENVRRTDRFGAWFDSYTVEGR